MIDYAEAKLVENVQNNQQKAVEFYLRHNSPRYASSRSEAQYSEKRTIGRLDFLPMGVDQAYLSGELALLEQIRHQKEIDDLILEVLGSANDPNEPIGTEKFDPYLTQAIFNRFPDAKEKFAQQITDYHKAKKTGAES